MGRGGLTLSCIFIYELTKLKLKERYNVDTTKTITHLSLCSGYEGIGLGLRSVLPNLREIAYVEREGFPVANLVAKMEAGELDAAPVFTDVKTFPYGKFRGCVDILSGGFPCQPFSAAGKRQATEDPRHLFPYIADGIRECQPRIVFLENVQGILSCKTADGEPVLQYVLRELEGLGYRATAGIFSAEEVGAPHQRKRVYILGVREELGNTSDLRLQQPSADSRETGTDQSGEERRMHESQGASSLSRHGPQSKGSQELANSNRGRGEIQDQGQLTSEQVLECNGSSWRTWPSRPGEPQNEWEEPRVVVNTTSKGLEGSRGSSLQGTDEGFTSADRITGQAEPRLGRTPNGSASRVDRLRLLGNGVVPQTAAKAFTTLSQRLI